MRNLVLKCLFAGAACLALCGLVLAPAFAAKSSAKVAATTVTIENWPGGLTGQVSSPNPTRCADGRRVVVYRARGAKPDPKHDERIGATRAQGAAGEFGWTVDSEANGLFYARAQAKKGCSAALSTMIGTAAPGAAAGAADSYPICGTYISETSSRICRIDNMKITTFAARGQTLCLWDRQDAASDCGSTAVSGPFPWLSNIQVITSWKKDGTGRLLTFQMNQWDRPGVTAWFKGRVPDPNSQRFTVTEASAPGENPVDSSTNVFYTPDLPNTLVGEVGGPLKLQVGDSPQGTAFTLNGYLYLKR